MFWPSTCQRRVGSARPRLIGFALISAIADRRSSLTGSFQPSVCCGVLRAPCSDRCCSCSTCVSLLPAVSAYLTSTPMTLIFTHGASINSCTAAATNGPWCSTDRRVDGFQQTDAAQPREDGLPTMCDLQTEYPS